MRCPTCGEEALPDAFMCKLCGSYLPDAATGQTERLTPPGAPACARCGAELQEGALIVLRERVYFAPGRLDAEEHTFTVGGAPRRLLPTASYRCPRCGAVETFADDRWP